MLNSFRQLGEGQRFFLSLLGLDRFLAGNNLPEWHILGQLILNPYSGNWLMSLRKEEPRGTLGTLIMIVTGPLLPINLEKD